MCGIRDTGTRKKLLQEAKLTLQRCINTCRSAETTTMQMKATSGKDVNALNQKGKKVWKSKSNTSVVDCKFCGRKHERSRDKCPAFGKECTKIMWQRKPLLQLMQTKMGLSKKKERATTTMITASRFCSKIKKKLLTRLTVSTSNQKSLP